MHWDVGLPAVSEMDRSRRRSNERTRPRRKSGKTTQTTSIMRPLIDYNAKLPSPLMMINSKLKWTRFDKPPCAASDISLIEGRGSLLVLIATACLHTTSPSTDHAHVAVAWFTKIFVDGGPSPLVWTVVYFAYDTRSPPFP